MSGKHPSTVVRLLLVLGLVSVLAACGSGGNSPPGQYTIGGAVSGLSGSGLILQDGVAGSVAVGTNGGFVFPGSVQSGVSYAVTVSAQPTSPSQTCSVSHGTGIVASANVADIVVTCVTTTYSVGGVTSGLLGSGLVLRNNGGSDLALTADGAFSFATAVASGGNYSVTVAAQPTNPSQTCTVANGSGAISAANISNVAVTCTVNTYSVGGSISGLAGSGLALSLNGGASVSPTADGPFSFAGRIASGGSYSVAVVTQPTNPSQTCTVMNASGSISVADIGGVAVVCATNTYTVGGSVSGLAGSGLVLGISGGANLAVTGNGTFVFAGQIQSGASYGASILAQPTGPSQTCALTNATGTVGVASVTNITVVCTTNTYRVGGTVSGLIGAGLDLQINNGGDLAVAANGAFVFGSPLPSGQAYAVTVKTQPATPAQTCVLQNSSGTVTSFPIDVTITCTVSPARFAYVGSHAGIYCYAIDAVSGALAPLATSQCVTGTLTGVAVEPSGHFAYATSSSDQIFPYSIDQSTGLLSRLVGAEVNAGTAPLSLAAHPSGKFLYASNYGSSSVTAYKIDSNTGALGSVPGSPFATGSHPNWVTVDPSGKYLYTANAVSRDVSAFAIDSGTGALTPVTGSPFATSGGGVVETVAVDPATKFVFVTNLSTSYLDVYSIDGTTGTLTHFSNSSLTPGQNGWGVATDATGAFLYVAADGIASFSIAPVTGSLTPLTSSVVAPGSPVAIQFNPVQNTLYVTDGATIVTYSVNPTTGALTEVSGTAAASSGNYDIAISR